jgi:transposase
MSRDASPPNDVTTLQQALSETRRKLSHTEHVLAETATTCEAQQAQLAKLQEELELLKRYLFGRRSERHVPDPRQGLLPLADDAEPPSVLPPPTEEEITYRRRKGHGWSKLPENLQRTEVLLEVPEDQRQCSACGQAMQKIGEDRSERLNIVPARVWVKVLVRPKYACTCGGGGVKQTPPPPAPVPGGRFDFSLVAHVVTSKIADHLPLYRQQDILARSGIELSRATLCQIMAAAAELGWALVDFMIRRLLAVDLLGADDTPVRLLDGSHPAGVRLARFWLFRGFEEVPYNVFYFHESRARDGPNHFLRDFHGTVKVDAYGVNEGVYLGTGGRITASCCLAHARRKFEESQGSHPVLSAEALAFFQELYDIEDLANELVPEDRRALRQCEAAPIIDRLRAWLDQQLGTALPKLKFGEAVRYLRNQWEPLVRYLDDGRLPIDNNAVESDLRALTIGRRNWLFIGSPEAGPRAAVLYTLVASAARHDLDICAYLRDVLERLAVLHQARADRLAAGKQPSPYVADDLIPLLPDVWAKAHPESIRVYRQHERENRVAAKRARREKRRALARAHAARNHHG